MSVLSACCAYCETKNDRICFRFARTVRAIILTVRFANREIGTGSCDGEGQTVMRGSHGAEVSPETAEKRTISAWTEVMNGCMSCSFQ